MRRIKTIFRLVKLSIRITAALGCVLLSILIVRSYYVGHDIGGRITFARSQNPNAIDSTLIRFDQGYLFLGTSFGFREVLPTSAIPRVTEDQRDVVQLGRKRYINSQDFLQFYFASRNPYDQNESLGLLDSDHLLGVYWKAHFIGSPATIDPGDGIGDSEGDYEILLAFPAWLLLIPGFLIAQPWKLISVTRKRRRRSKNLCPACGYDTRASPGRCSECGATIS